jgi:peroxiredoxin
LFQNVNPDLPVFSQTTDALHFRNALDSLSAVYPDSKYVKALERETTRREGILGFDSRLSTASEAEYPDIKSKDINGNEVSLQALDSKAVILFFWTVTDPESKILNQETYKPVYKDYHDKGLEIFAVSLDTDKAAWASVVKSQELPWVNVNDGLGASSPAATLYNVTSLPRAYLILDGKIVDRRVEGEKALRRELDKVLK